MQQFFHSVEQLGTILSDQDHKNILLVTGSHSYEQSGANTMLEPLFRKHNVARFKSVRSNPKLDEIEPAIQLYRNLKPDIVIAVGGGSVIDTAKAARLLAAQDNPIKKVIKDNTMNHAPESLFIAIPTTAGSGAESTHFAVIYIGKDKYSPAHANAIPNVVILDPRLTYSLPPHTTAATGMDAIAQAIEALWSVKSTEISRSLSQQALGKLLPNIERAVLDPTPASRQAMLEGANFAGQAINIALTTAPHAISYGLTTNCGLDHGEAVSLTLPQFMIFNASLDEADCQDTRGVKFVDGQISAIVKTLGATDIIAASKKIDQLANTIGLRRTLQTNEPKQIIAMLSRTVNEDRLKNNPRIVTQDDMHSILARVIR